MAAAAITMILMRGRAIGKNELQYETAFAMVKISTLPKIPLPAPSLAYSGMALQAGRVYQRLAAVPILRFQIRLVKWRYSSQASRFATRTRRDKGW